MLPVYLAALALIATSLVASGCGGSSKTVTTSAAATSTPTTTVSTATTAPATTTTAPVVTVQIAAGRPLAPAEWKAKAENICGRLNAELNAIKVKSTSELTTVLPQVAAYERIEVAELAKLVPPPSKAGDWQQFLNDTLQWAEDSSKLAGSSKLGDAISRSPLVETAKKLHEHFAKIVAHDGFKECAFV